METTTNLTEFKSSTWPEKAFMKADAAWVLQANGTNSAMLATVRSHTTPVAAPSTQKGASRQSNNVCMLPVYLNNQHLPQHTTSSPSCKLLGYETLTAMPKQEVAADVGSTLLPKQQQSTVAEATTISSTHTPNSVNADTSKLLLLLL
jgi:hypothetical protein